MNGESPAVVMETFIGSTVLFVSFLRFREKVAPGADASRDDKNNRGETCHATWTRNYIVHDGRRNGGFITGRLDRRREIAETWSNIEKIRAFYRSGS